MTFCKLPDGQKAALLFLQSIIAAPAGGKFAKLKDALINKKWEVIVFVAGMMSGDDAPAPSADDFQAVGTLPEGVRNAYFVLAMVDASATDDAKAKLSEALDTHCYNDVANKIVESISTTGVKFTGEDLRQAYAPNDHEPCKGPNAFEVVIGELIKDGKLVGNFFSKTLPDFFEHDFVNFFSHSIPDFFTGDFVNFFKNFGNSLKDGFEGLGETLKDAFQDFGKKLDPTHW